MRKTGRQQWKVATPTSVLLADSLKNCRNLCQNLVHDRIGHVFQLSAVARAEIERAGLVAADNAGGFSTGTGQRYRKSGSPRELPAAGDGEPRAPW